MLHTRFGGVWNCRVLKQISTILSSLWRFGRVWNCRVLKYRKIKEPLFCKEAKSHGTQTELLAIRLVALHRLKRLIISHVDLWLLYHILTKKQTFVLFIGGIKCQLLLRIGWMRGHQNDGVLTCCLYGFNMWGTSSDTVAIKSICNAYCLYGHRNPSAKNHSNSINQYSCNKNNAYNLNFVFFFVQLERWNENYGTYKRNNTYSFP